MQSNHPPTPAKTNLENQFANIQSSVDQLGDTDLNAKLGAHITGMLSFLESSMLPRGRILKTLDLHVDAETGDIDIDIKDDQDTESEHFATAAQNKLNIEVARRETDRQRVVLARSLLAEDRWIEGLEILQTIEQERAENLEDEFTASLIRTRREVEYYIQRNLESLSTVANVSPDKCEKSVVELIERFSDSPQSIFFIEHGGKTWVGRKTLSRNWSHGNISELFCSMVSPTMILGQLISHRVSEDGILVYFRPISKSNGAELFRSLAANSDSELRFPFVYLTDPTRSEVVSPGDGWFVNETVREQLYRGETFLREFTMRAVLPLAPKNAVLYDPACSTGDFLADIQSSLPGSKSIGQDLSPAMIEFAKRRLDIAFTADAIESPVNEESVDIAFLRFLNSEVVNSKNAMDLFDAIIKRVKRNGLVVIFGHTPVLIDSGFLLARGCEIISRIGTSPEGEIFQFYILRRGVLND